MSMDYSAMWSVVDAHRHCADELEQTLRELTGDRPVPVGPDKIDLYSEIIDALWQSRDALYDLAAREGHNIRRQDASRCRVFAGRCNHVMQNLQELGEL